MRSWFLVNALLLASVTAPAHGTIVLGSELQLHAAADKWGSVNPAVRDGDTKSQGSTLTSMFVSVDAHDNTSDISVRAFGSGSARWASADAGEVAITNAGWEIVNAHAYQVYLAGTPYGSYAFPSEMWTYTFVPEVDSTFEMLWDISHTDDTTGRLLSSPFNLSFSGTDGMFDRFDMAFDTRDSLSQMLSAGVQYTVYVGHHLQSGGGGQPRTVTTKYDANFNWRISPVPAPGSAILLVLGLIILTSQRQQSRLY